MAITSGMPVLRAPRAEDAGDLASLLSQLGYPADPRDIPARLSTLASSSTAEAWVAEVSGRVVGLATAHVIQSLHKPDVVAMLTVLVVDANTRHGGIGRALVQHAEAWAMARGATAISLTSALRRVDAHAFYRRLGYDQTGVRLGKVLTPGPVPASAERPHQKTFP